MIASIYRVAASLAAPGLRVMLNRRARRGKEIAGRLAERRGYSTTPRPPGRLAWVHCASVGEATSVLPLIESLLPLIDGGSVLLTTGTVTSAEMLAQRLPRLNLDRRVIHRFVPLDVPAWVGRFLDHWRPDAAVFVESEIWPNTLAACHRRGIPTALVNGRMSERSFARWQRVLSFAQTLFGGFERVIAQSDDDAARLKQLGASTVTVAGNLKFAASPLPVARAELERLRERLGGRPVWLAASTHPGEETIACAVHAALRDRHPGLLTIIAPRHPVRGAEIAGAITTLTVTRRGIGQDPPEGEGVWLADTMGELGLLFSLVGHAFVGGSLVPIGGHNPLEPARLGCAVAIGPHTFNCVEAVTVLEQAGALTRVADAPALALWIDGLLRDPERRREMGDFGIVASRRYADVSSRTASGLAELVRRRA